ncbi:hypothetical protein PF005_g23594 [Phytophthora fragariae]|uniref:Uncharacterized protein n=1 Tax=Phytophthora fragariae TaxID=53985 RepID=A0A6A3QJ64_9STRA|nr:hypothetical protein PF009_g17654 [Phytophthora fragariae]KAE9077204.1 hypothetical protein PF007_g24331 [Phytophthora fragariae]KAE9102566.1 hypothetical protein PF006_g22393 [Phytophthora fragariae]KAE9179704.1 hypothetical protein PF005_g23594 [Phytophthora fragariae]KAE9190750.1 hypothetical protein PF002_g24686 [Phytophthora fragariae]
MTYTTSTRTPTSAPRAASTPSAFRRAFNGSHKTPFAGIASCACKAQEAWVSTKRRSRFNNNNRSAKRSKPMIRSKQISF